MSGCPCTSNRRSHSSSFRRGRSQSSPTCRPSARSNSRSIRLPGWRSACIPLPERVLVAAEAATVAWWKMARLAAVATRTSRSRPAPGRRTPKARSRFLFSRSWLVAPAERVRFRSRNGRWQRVRARLEFCGSVPRLYDSGDPDRQVMASPHDVTALLADWSRGDRGALGQLLPLVYEELRGIAARQLGRERVGHTL